jgi:hypothetical protein
MRVRDSLLLAGFVVVALVAAGAGTAGAATTCPASRPTSEVASRQGSTTALVPRGADAVLLCRYRGLNPGTTAGLLLRSRLITSAATVTGLAADLDAIPPTKPGTVFSCPMDNGDAILAVFAYRTGPTDPVMVDLTGCTTATNGRVRRIAGSAGVGLLESLTR